MRSRTTIGILAGVALVLTTVEIAVRIASPSLVRPLSWYSQEAQVKADELVFHRNEPGWADVVFVGNSLARDAFNPVQFMDDAPCRLTAYNAALTGFRPRNLEHWLEDWVLPLARPAAVVVGVTSADLGAPGDFHDHYFQAAAVRTGATAEIVRWLSRGSALLRYRAVLRDPVYLKPTVARLVPGITPYEPWERFVRGYANPGGPSMGSPPPVAFPDPLIDADEVRALDESLRMLAHGGITTWVVEMPIQQQYKMAHPGGEKGYRRAMDLVRRLANRHRARYVDLSDLLTSVLHFQDLRHPSTAGARIATSRITEELASLCPRASLPLPSSEGQTPIVANIRYEDLASSKTEL